jgi:hypothetical protein
MNKTRQRAIQKHRAKAHKFEGRRKESSSVAPTGSRPRISTPTRPRSASQRGQGEGA